MHYLLMLYILRRALHQVKAETFGILNVDVWIQEKLHKSSGTIRLTWKCQLDKNDIATRYKLITNLLLSQISVPPPPISDTDTKDREYYIYYLPLFARMLPSNTPIQSPFPGNKFISTRT